MKCYQCECESETLFPILQMIKDRKVSTPVEAFVCRDCFKKALGKD